MNKTTLILFVLILVLAIFLRVFRLDSVPPALFGDEVDVGYQAYSLLKTGKDLTGRFLPFYIKSLSEYRTPLYIYSAIPFVGVFGLNEWGVRLPAVFWGITSIIGIFLLGRKLIKTKTGLIAMFLMSISPWHLQYSRASFEVTMLISFLIFGVYFFLKGPDRIRYYIPSTILLISSIYIYSTAVVFVPLLVLLMLSIYWKEIKRTSIKNLFFVTLTTMIILLPVGMSLITGEAKERFSAISIFQDTVLLDKLNLARKGEEFTNPEGMAQKTNPQTEAIFHNKPMVFAQVFITNYFRALNPSFLFSEGDINFRHSIHEMGEEYYFVSILLLLGIFALIKGDNRRSLLVLGWLVLAPIPSSLTNQGGFHATRLIIMLPAISLLAGIGGSWILENWKSLAGKGLITLLTILFIFNLTFYLHRYYLHYPPESWRWWHVGFKEAMLYIKSVESQYQLVGFNNTYEPSLIRFLFWSRIDPATFQQHYPQTLKVGEVFPDINGFKFTDKYFFASGLGKPIGQVLPPGSLYMVSARDEVPGDWDWSKNPPEGIKVLKTVYNPLGEPIFYVITKN